MSAVIAKILLSFELLKAKKWFLYFKHVEGPYLFAEVEFKKKCIWPSLKKKNPFDIRVPYIKITGSEHLFEQYRMALNGYKYYIEIRNIDAINRNRIFFDFIRIRFIASSFRTSVSHFS